MNQKVGKRRRQGAGDAGRRTDTRTQRIVSWVYPLSAVGLAAAIILAAIYVEEVKLGRFMALFGALGFLGLFVAGMRSASREWSTDTQWWLRAKLLLPLVVLALVSAMYFLRFHWLGTLPAAHP